MSSAAKGAPAAAIAEGKGSVAIAAPVSNAVIVTGKNNTVEMRFGAAGALLAFVFRWHRPRRRRRRHRAGCPPPFAGHVDREDESGQLVGDGGLPRAANVYAAPGLGKTYLIVAVLNRLREQPRDGVVYLDGRGQSADDLLHAIFDDLYELRVRRRDEDIGRYLRRARLAIALEDVELAPDETQRLLLGTPDSRLFLTSRARTLFDDMAIELNGVAPEYAADLAEQELGRPLDDDERDAARTIGTALGGRPLELRQIFTRARDDNVPLARLAAEADVARPSISGDAAQKVARALAVHGDAALGLEHLRRLVDAADVDAAAQGLERSHVADTHSPRYHLVGRTAAELPASELTAETDRALAYFTGWLREHQDDPAGVARELPALVALLERAHAEGRSQAVIELGQLMDRPLCWSGRWRAWGWALDLVLESARAAGDDAAVGWALHQLGTRAFASGHAAEAQAKLQQALELREAVGDERGADATRQNLGVVLHRPPLLYRLSHLPAALLGAALAVLITAGGVAGAAIIGGPGRVRLDVEVRGPGQVVSAPSGIRCSPACTTRFAKRAKVTLTAQTAAGATFVGWRGNACKGEDLRCMFTIRTDESVTAVFKLPRTVSLRVTVEGSGTVKSRPAAIACPGRCERAFATGQRVSLTATASPGWAFAGWGGACNGTQTCALTMTNAHSVLARFSKPAVTHTLTIHKGGEGDGRVTSTPSGIECGYACTTSLPDGSRVALEATEDPGSSFQGWSGGKCSGTKPCRITMDGDIDVTAAFGKTPGPEVALTVTIAGNAPGTVTSNPPRPSCSERCTRNFPQDSQVVLTALAGDSRFIGWRGAGCEGIGICSITMTGPKSVTAVFGPGRPPSVTLTTRTVGPVEFTSPANCGGGCSYPVGEVVTLRARATEPTGYVSWAECTPDKKDPNTCTVEMSQDKLVTATFNEVY